MTEQLSGIDTQRKHLSHAIRKITVSPGITLPLDNPKGRQRDAGIFQHDSFHRVPGAAAS